MIAAVNSDAAATPDNSFQLDMKNPSSVAQLQRPSLTMPKPINRASIVRSQQFCDTLVTLLCTATLHRKCLQKGNSWMAPLVNSHAAR
jgi:hypothetical protein